MNTVPASEASAELVAEFPRNPSGETIRVERDADGLIRISAWNPLTACSISSFVCNESHVSPLIDALVKTMNTLGRMQ